eukprot:CFRG1587T1
MSVPSTCKAALLEEVGGPSNVKVIDVDVKPVGPGQVVVKSEYAAINPVDALVMGGHLKSIGWDLPLPFVMGYDISGTVAAVGEGVTNVAVGDRVFCVNWGQQNHNVEGGPIANTFKEYATIKATNLSKIPDGVPADKACAVCLTGTTAYEAVINMNVKKGDRVLILGGAGAVGQLAIQFAKAAGVWVATTASARTRDFVQKISNPDLIIDYREGEKWHDRADLKDIDAVFASVSESNTFTLAKKILKKNGCYVSISDQEAGFDPKAHPPLEFAAFFCLSNSRDIQDKMARMIADGSLNVVIDDEFPFTNEGVQAIMTKQASGTSMGKNLIKF